MNKTKEQLQREFIHLVIKKGKIDIKIRKLQRELKKGSDKK